MSVDVSVEIGRGRIGFNTGYLAKQADRRGCCFLWRIDSVCYGGSVTDVTRDKFFP